MSDAAASSEPMMLLTNKEQATGLPDRRRRVLEEAEKVGLPDGVGLAIGALQKCAVSGCGWLAR